MGTYPHQTGPRDEPGDRLERDAEPVVPRPLPQRGNPGSRAALAVMLVALVIIVLVVLL